MKGDKRLGEVEISMAEVKKDIAYIKKDITFLKSQHESNFQELKNILKEHNEWEHNKYNGFKEDFAGKWVERAIVAVGTTVIGGILLYVINFI